MEHWVVADSVSAHEVAEAAHDALVSLPIGGRERLLHEAPSLFSSGRHADEPSADPELWEPLAPVVALSQVDLSSARETRRGTRPEGTEGRWPRGTQSI